MKRALILLGAVALVTVAFASCRKCSTCTARDRTTNTIVDETEYCGPRNIVQADCDSYELIWNDTYYSASCD